MNKEEKYIKPYSNYINNKGVWIIEFLKEDLVALLNYKECDLLKELNDNPIDGGTSFKV